MNNNSEYGNMMNLYRIQHVKYANINPFLSDIMNNGFINDEQKIKYCIDAARHIIG